MVSYKMAIMASVQPESGQISLDPTFCIQFSSVLSKKAWTKLCKTSPDLIWMAWSGFGPLNLVQKQTSVQESSGLLLAKASKLTQIRCKSDPVHLLWALIIIIVQHTNWWCEAVSNLPLKIILTERKITATRKRAGCMKNVYLFHLQPIS